jgi:putative ABC transport system permease protein
MVTAGYFDTLGVRVTKGRSIDAHDTDTTTRVAMVNENFVRRFLPEVEPVGQRLVINQSGPGTPDDTPVEYQIVGVFHNVRGAVFAKTILKSTCHSGKTRGRALQSH